MAGAVKLLLRFGIGLTVTTNVKFELLRVVTSYVTVAEDELVLMRVGLIIVPVALCPTFAPETLPVILVTVQV